MLRGATVVAAVLAVVPGSASAATTIGSDLTGSPTETCRTSVFECNMTQLAVTATSATITAPSAGLVTAIRLKHGALLGDNLVGFRILTPTGNANEFTARIVPWPSGAFALSTAAGTDTMVPVDSQDRPKGVPIAAGDRIAVHLNSSDIPVVDTSRTGVGEVSGNHSSGNATYAAQTGELQLQATIEPDANGNGYGDETQEVPAAPSGLTTNPPSPADDNSPEIQGTAAAGTTVKLYTTADCSGSPVATGTAAAFASPGFTVTVADNTTNPFYATASNANGTSPCSAGVTYSEVTSSPGGGNPGGGNPGGGNPGGGNPGGGANNLCPPNGNLPAAKLAASGKAAIDRSRAYDSGRVVFDSAGRRHVAGVTTINSGQLNYFGPGGARTVDSLGTVPGDYALAIAGGQPVLGYGRHIVEQDPHPADEIGVDHRCEVFFLARGPGFTPQAAIATQRDQDGFHTLDMAAEAKTGTLHLAYTLGDSDQLVYRTIGAGGTTALPMKNVNGIRVGAAGGVLAVAASSRGTLRLFTRKGAGPFKALTIAKNVGAWDMAVGSDGKPRLAYQRHLRLELFNGSARVKTSLPADEVAIAVDSSKRMNVVFDLAPNFGCARSHFGNFVIRRCIANALYFVRTNRSGSRGALKPLGKLALSSPLSIAVHGRKAAVVYADRGNKSALVVRSP